MNNSVRYCLVSLYASLVCLVLQSSLLYTSFYEFGVYREYGYNEEKYVTFKSKAYCIPFTNKYNIKTERGWCYLDLSNISDDEEINLPMGKTVNLNDYGDVVLYQRNVGITDMVGYIVSFSILLGVILFVSSLFYNKVKSFVAQKDSRDEDLSEYTILK